jgi:hypothetical protein
LKRAQIQIRLNFPPDQHLQHPESGVCRALYDCPDVPVGPEQKPCRVVIATHPASARKSRVGVTRDGVVYELFFTNLPQSAFTAADVVGLYLHRGAFENALADEDLEQEPDRWCSQPASGKAGMANRCSMGPRTCVWNWAISFILTRCAPPRRAPAIMSAPAYTAPSSGYALPQVGLPWKAGRFSGQDFPLQPDGTLRCPAGQKLSAHERRREADGSLRVVYAASIRSCRPCALREQCQWQGKATTKPRQVSVLLHPLNVGAAPLLWGDWSRRRHRRACMQLLRGQRLEVQMAPPLSADPDSPASPLSRTQRAHYRLDWSERLARNARVPITNGVTIRLFGVPEDFAISLGMATA